MNEKRNTCTHRIRVACLCIQFKFLAAEVKKHIYKYIYLYSAHYITFNSFSLMLVIIIEFILVCKDESAYCDSYKSYCKDPLYKDYLKENCKKTCNLCGKILMFCRRGEGSVKFKQTLYFLLYL